MIANDVITIYNRTYNSKARLDEWTRTVVRGVHVHVDHKVTIGEKGLNSANLYKIRIPHDAGVEGELQVNDGDYIVIGEGPESITAPADLQKAGIRHCKILSWSDNSDSTQPHIRVEGA